MMCALVLGASMIVAATDITATQYNFRERPLTDITSQQPNALVVPPEIFRSLGEQGKALEDNEKQFIREDQNFKEVNSRIDKVSERIKPLEDTNTIVRFILWAIGALLSFGAAGFGIHVAKLFYQKKQGATNASQSAILAAIAAVAEEPQSGDK